ncbi:MAG: beta-propeller domain-containing protein, partial [Clostridiales Family XIII bacterium]|nr:beta-propeller domain-containing protein [Clostridiales Family XIII bacterium]
MKDKAMGMKDKVNDGFDGTLSGAMKKLVEDDSAKIDYFKDFDESMPSAKELLDKFGGRRKPRRTKRFVWGVSSLAAAVAIMLLVTTVYSPGAFKGVNLGEADQATTDESAADSDSVAVETSIPVGSAPGVSEVTPAELPAPQSDYNDVYAALNDGGRLDDMMVYSQREADALAVGAAEAQIDSGAKESGAEAADGSGRDVTDAAPPPASTATSEKSEAPPSTTAPSETSTAPAPPNATAPGPAANEEAPAEDSAETTSDSAKPETADAPIAEEPAALDAGASAADGTPKYSDTNIQTEGVQEADVVKTDGKYIYTANSKSICITAANSGHPDVVSEIPQPTADGQVIFEMYIKGDTLTLIRQGYNNLRTKGDGDGATKEKQTPEGCIAYPGEQYMIDTAIDVYDVSDRAAPRKVRSLSQSGGYTDSRMIGDKLYLISNYGEFDYAAMDKGDPRTYVPLYAEGTEQLTPEPENIYIPTRTEYMSYTVVSGIDTSKARFVSRESLFGESFTVYASTGNLYLSAMKYGYEEKEDGSGYRISKNSDYTRVTRLSLKDGKVKVEASADVPGIVDSQFSLDERKGTLRMVTTYTEYVDASKTENGDGQSYSERYYGENNESSPNESDNKKTMREIEQKYGKLEWSGDHYGYRESRTTGLYVLDLNLKVLGKVDNLAPDEQVYSCRYIGDVAYFVTFRNTDPLFSVDLSDPSHPKVMGKLKIPGFSDYLHPYADGLLFGIGFDADEDTGEVESVKVSMFDNSDPFDVKEKDKLILDGFYSTEAAGNHKAILVDSRKGLIAFPADGDYVIMNYEEGKGFSRVMDVTLDSAG